MKVFNKTFFNTTSGNYGNITYVNISSHQYDEVVNMSVNISGIYVDNLVFYRTNTTLIDRVYHGALLRHEIFLNRTTENETDKNLSFNVAGEQYIYFYLDDNSKINNFTMNASGWKYGFSYYDEFNTFGNISDSGNALLKGGLIFSNASNLTEFVYDDFEDETFSDTLSDGSKWFKSTNLTADDCTISGNGDWSCNRYGQELNGYYEMYASITEIMSGVELGSSYINNVFYSNRTFFNLYVNDKIKVTLDYDYFGANQEYLHAKSCNGHANLTIGEALVWTSLIDYCAGDVGKGCSDTSTSPNMTFDIQRQQNASWFVNITGFERSYGTEQWECGIYSMEYNWTAGTWTNESQNCPDGAGTLNNTFYIYPNYREYIPLRPLGIDIFVNGTYADSDNSGCSQANFKLRVHSVNRSKYDMSNGTVISNSIFDSSSDITSATMTVVGNTPSTELVGFFLSADDGENWEGVSNGVEHSFSNPGKNIRWLINFSVRDNVPYANDTTWVSIVNISTNESFPSDVYFDFGDDGIVDYSLFGLINQTNGTFVVDLSQANLSEAFTSLKTAYDHLYSIPLRISTDSAGLIQITNINLTYDPNPVMLNITSIQDYLINSNGSVNFSIPLGSVGGSINISDIRYDYAGGNSSINITIHTADYSYVNQTNVTFWYSKWDYGIVPKLIQYLEFLPKTPTDKNVSASGQSNLTAILNLTNQGYGGMNVSLSASINDTFSCVNLTISNTSNKLGGFILNETWKNITGTGYLETQNLWLWADYECSYSSWNLFNPSLYFRHCCVDCICAEDI